MKFIKKLYEKESNQNIVIHIHNLNINTIKPKSKNIPKIKNISKKDVTLEKDIFNIFQNIAIQNNPLNEDVKLTGSEIFKNLKNTTSRSEERCLGKECYSA